MFPKCNWRITYSGQIKKRLQNAVEIQYFFSEWPDQQVNYSQPNLR